MNWNESMKDYAVKISKIYKVAPEGIMSCLRFGSMTDSLNQSYLSLVREGMRKIEDLQPLEKSRIWTLSEKYATGKEERIRVSRAIYLLEELTK